MTNKFPIITSLLQELSALGELLNGLQNGATDTGAPAEVPATPTTSRRGRPPKETPAAEDKGTQLISAEQETELRKLAAELIEKGEGLKVQTLINKHGGDKKFASLPAASFAAFSRDLEALTM